jgi:hypothetical protein
MRSLVRKQKIWFRNLFIFSGGVGSPDAPPQFTQYPPPIPPKPARVVKLSHFLLVTVILLILLAITVGIAFSYSNQLRDYSRLQSQFSILVSQNFDLQNQIQKLKIQTSNPTLTQWTGCSQPCYMTPGNWRVGGVPDTFDFNVSFTASVQITVYIITFQGYVQFANCAGSISCVNSTYTQYGPATSIHSSVFKLAEGCSDYVAVFQSTTTGLIYPDVSVTYNPAPTTTGVC